MVDKMTPILSILIPTTPDRSEMFTKLWNELHRQITYMDTFHPSLGSIEVLFNDSKRFLDGGLSIGKKREALVKLASGKYLCFLDSDDFPSPNYVERLVRLCLLDRDVVTFRNISKFDNCWAVVDMSLYAQNEDLDPMQVTERRPFHICPVRSEYAKLYPFPDVNYGEDFIWMEQVLKHCLVEAHTFEVLHEYRHSTSKSESDKILKAGYV